MMGATISMNAANKIDRIEPTDWFVGMKNPQVQLMVYGKDIRTADVTTDYPGVSYEGAHYLHDRLLSTGKFDEVNDGEFLKEFVLKPLCDVEKMQKAFLDAGFFAGLQTEEGYVTFCVTEKHPKEELDKIVEIVKAL